MGVIDPGPGPSVVDRWEELQSRAPNFGAYTAKRYLLGTLSRDPRGSESGSEPQSSSSKRALQPVQIQVLMAGLFAILVLTQTPVNTFRGFR